ncbi:MAG: hypothetical protein R3E01_23475 [Pirellulaceae bacterium]|nr:hypothetical protein [Planctomycetales bacterium]
MNRLADEARRQALIKSRQAFPWRVQLRLATLIIALVLVLVMMQRARRPDNWRWMFRSGDAQEGHLSVTQPSQVDGADATESPPANVVPSENGRLWGTINPQWLSTVRDDTVFRAAESTAWYGILAKLKALPSPLVPDAPRYPVGPLQLQRQSPAYRGCAVRVEGTVRRAHRIVAPPNEAGIEAYWQCWLSTTSESEIPVVVYSLEMPNEFPEGMTLNESVTFTGIFFKRWAYEAVEGPRTAPLVLARAPLEWTPPVTTSPAPDRPLPSPLEFVGWVLLAATVAALFSWRVWRGYRRPTRSITEAAAPDFAQWESPHTPPRDAL